MIRVLIKGNKRLQPQMPRSIQTFFHKVARAEKVKRTTERTKTKTSIVLIMVHDGLDKLS